ncbi:MAG: retention module-containing protein, partial [Proteobacteria bacterium]|nr:retention module-containing protein [Pseudomonadota bacterium]
MTINETNTTETGNGQAIGTAVIVSGSVQVESPDGATRALQVNGVVFANETIITGGTGKVSIVFNDSAHSQLDLGRMSEVVLDGDVVPGEQGVDLSDVASEVAQLQEALLQGDPTQDLPAPAAGPVAAGAGARGGGHPTVVFDLTGEEVTPTSGAETIGVARSFLDPERLTGEIDEVVEAPVVEPLAVGITPPGDDIEEPPNTIPLAGDYSSVIDEANFLDGSEPVSTPLTVSGGLATLGIDFGGDGPGSISIGGQSIDMDNLGGSADTSITVAGDYGSLQLWDDGSWTYTITTNIDHPLTDTTGAGDSLPDLFAFTVFDSNGDSATGTLTINILDDGPVASDIVLTRVVEEEALDNSLSVGNPDENDGPEDSDFNSTYQNDAAQVNGSLAPLVTMGADNPGTFSWGSLLDLPGLSSQGGQVVYEMNANGTTLEAWVHDGMPARISSDFEGGESDRLVFTLDLQPDGSYVFTLLDQLDHVSGDGENTALLLWGEGGESVTSLDFATAIIATDSDDDTTGLTPGALSFLIVDDVPELSAMEEPLTVYEDGLDTAAGDESDGIGGGVTDVTINLASLVADGADEHVTYTLLDNLSYQPTGLTSDGKQVSYSVTGNVLTAATVDNTVFTFTLDPFTG